jgi:hypothetical protein
LEADMKHRLFTAVACGMLIAPGVTLAQDETTLEHLVVEMASTPAEHEAVARHYAARADEARQEMRRHERMARAYTASKTSQPQRMRNHCLALASKYGEIATEFDELAKLHEGEAGEGR